MNEKEFRMIEPESIAIWWGHHKNKPGMTYDKFSRSLRYYYDKGILKKIPGERFVYRFLIDPEVIYEHIGTSDCRPKIKPMPKAAKAAMTKFHKNRGLDFKTHDVRRITQKAETLGKNSEAMISTSTQKAVQKSVVQTSSLGGNFHTTLHSSSSTGNLATLGTQATTSLPIRRSKSLETARTNVQLNHQNSLPFSLPSSAGSNHKCILSSEIDARAVPELTPLGYGVTYW
jgi:hypothetical protein